MVPGITQTLLPQQSKPSVGTATQTWSGNAMKRRHLRAFSMLYFQECSWGRSQLWALSKDAGDALCSSPAGLWQTTCGLSTVVGSLVSSVHNLGPPPQHRWHFHTRIPRPWYNYVWALHLPVYAFISTSLSNFVWKCQSTPRNLHILLWREGSCLVMKGRIPRAFCFPQPLH